MYSYVCSSPFVLPAETLGQNTSKAVLASVSSHNELRPIILRSLDNGGTGERDFQRDKSFIMRWCPLFLQVMGLSSVLIGLLPTPSGNNQHVSQILERFLQETIILY